MNEDERRSHIEALRSRGELTLRRAVEVHLEVSAGVLTEDQLIHGLLGSTLEERLRLLEARFERLRCLAHQPGSFAAACNQTLGHEGAHTAVMLDGERIEW